MPALTRSYTCEHELLDDGSVGFMCSQNLAEWPWLALAPQHPLVIQTQNFWTSVGAGKTLGTRDESKWSALTWTRWELGEPGAGIAHHGRFERTQGGDEMSFQTRLMDAADRLIVHIEGKGVIFRTRNFESWREGAKQSAHNAAMAPARFPYAPRQWLGLTDEEPPLIAAMETLAGKQQTKALLTHDNALMPAHPFFSGSGDHVNTPHLAEIARQVVSLLRQGAPFLIASAQMDMHRYIELGTPMEIGIEDQREGYALLAIRQLQRSCARLTLEWAPA